MAEENQQVQQEPQQVTTKNPKKVEAGKRLAAHNHRKRRRRRKRRREKKREEVEKGGVSQYYSIGAVQAVGVIGGLCYYIYRTKKGEVNMPHNPTVSQQPCPQTNKFEMD